MPGWPGPADRRLQRIRSERSVAPCRASRPGVRAHAHPAPWRPAGRRRRRRDRDDRRSVRAARPSATCSSREQVIANTASIQAQLEHFLDFSPGRARRVVVDNYDWLGPIGMLEFLRDVGKHFTIPYMLAKDSVQRRLEAGLSYTEFSYMLLQSADFLHLYRTLDVELQTGGADQWGNMTAGLELIRRVEGARGGGGARPRACRTSCCSAPNGKPFGKTAEGTSVWLDPERTSPYAFYQFWLDAEDDLAGRLIRLFTLLDRAAIEALEAEAAGAPERRLVQRALAHDLTARVHGPEVAERVIEVSEAVFSRRLPELGEAALAFAFEQLPHAVVRTADVAAGPIGLTVAAGLFGSNGEARRAIAQGGVSVNELRVGGVDAAVPEPIGGRYLVLRSGKSTYWIVRVDPDCTSRVRPAWRPRSTSSDGGRRRARARPAARGRGTGGRRSRRPGRRGSAGGRPRSASPAASSLAASSTSVASSVTFRPAASTPPSRRLRRVRARPGGPPRAAAIVDHRASSQAKPWRFGGGRPVRGIEAAPRPAVAGRPGGIGRDEQRVAVAVDGQAAEAEDVAARLALAPQPVARARVEVDLAASRAWPPGPRRRGSRPSGRARRRRPGRPPADETVRRRSATARGIEIAVPGHAAASARRRTGRPAAAIAGLTSAIAWIRRWKIEAARTASAPPSTTAATKSAGPRGATRGDDRDRGRGRDGPQQRGVEAGSASRRGRSR